MIRSVQEAAYLRAAAVEYIQRWIGTPYIWGGDDFSGFDCSGLVLEVLEAHGIIGRGYDTTANGLHDLLIKWNCRQPEKGYAGCLIFWYTNTSRHMVHVAMMVDDQFIVHAAGGGSGTLSREDAIKYNAYVRKDHIDYRSKNHVIIDPFLQEGSE